MQKNNIKEYNVKLNTLVTEKKNSRLKLKYSDNIKSENLIQYSIIVFNGDEILDIENSFEEILLPQESGKYKIFILLENEEQDKIQFAFEVELN